MAEIEHFVDPDNKQHKKFAVSPNLFGYFSSIMMFCSSLLITVMVLFLVCSTGMLSISKMSGKWSL